MHTIKTLGIIHGVLCAGLLLAMALFFFITERFSTQVERTDPFTYVVPVLALAAYFGSIYGFQRTIGQIEKDDVLERKLLLYQTASIIQYAVLEAAAFLALVAYFLTGNALHLAIAVSITLYLIRLRPSRKRFLKTVPLNPSQRRSLDRI